jgi:hypothetical protein
MTIAPHVLRWTHALYDQATTAGRFGSWRMC